jgi:flavin-dependent dehydrogenase
MPNSEQVIVVGGGPAGLAAAIAVRRRGFSVEVIDSARPPIEKVCGEGLLPETLASLRRIGVDPAWLHGEPFRGVRYIAGETQVEADFPGACALGMRRTDLHRSLIDAAARCGVTFRWETPVEGLDSEGIRAGGKRISAKWIIGADGQGSRVRTWAGLSAGGSSVQRYAFRRHYRGKPWTDLLEIHWSGRAQAYVTPVAKDEICIVVMSRDPRLRFDAAIGDFPALASRLCEFAAVDQERGAVSCNRVLRRVAAGTVALIGDASGTVDAITGEGLGLAFRQAVVLADALAAGDLRKYERAHRRLRAKPQFMANFMLTMERSTAVRRKAMSALAANPEIFAQILRSHAGSDSMLGAAAAGMRLGWNMLTR